MELEKVLELKQALVQSLLKKLKDARAIAEKEKIILCLIDNFKDQMILPSIVDEIKLSPLSESHAFYLYACAEYSLEECENYFDLWIDIVCLGNFHSSVNAGIILVNLPEPFEFEEDQVVEAQKKLMEVFKKDASLDKKDIVQEVLNLFD